MIKNKLMLGYLSALTILLTLFAGCSLAKTTAATTMSSVTSSTTSFTVSSTLSPTLTLTPDAGSPASQFTVNGSNFTPHSNVKSTDILWNGKPFIGDQIYNVDGAGYFAIVLTLSPQTVAGNYTIKVTDSAGISAVSTFTVLAQITTTAVTTPVCSSGPVYSNPVTYQITRTLSVTNTDTQLNWVRIWEPSVDNWGNAQTNVSSINTAPTPVSTWHDVNGNGGLFWEFQKSPGPGSSLTITNEFTFTGYQIDCQIDTSKLGPYDKTSVDYLTYTQPEKFIESTNPQIVALAVQLKQGEINPCAIVESNYDWVVRNLTYTISASQQLEGALYTLNSKSGECGDFSALFCALCRADGISARPIVGRIAKNATNDHDGLHVWAEFLLPGYGWVPADPTWENGGAKGENTSGIFLMAD